jgi:CRP-like cAMP-binding protein
MLSDRPTQSALSRVPPIKNGILSTLASSDFESLRTFLQPVLLKKGLVLNQANRTIEYVDFIETGMVSLITSGSMLETAMVGPHGVVDASIALGARTSIYKSIVLVQGKALRIRVEDLQHSMERRPQIREHLLHYVRSLMIQSSQRALCGACHELEQRLACWICLACDTLEGDTLPITHNHLSFILGLRRPSVTAALMRFEKLGLVQKARGSLRVNDRQWLEKKACSCYRVISAAHTSASIGSPTFFGMLALSQNRGAETREPARPYRRQPVQPGSTG